MNITARQQQSPGTDPECDRPQRGRPANPEQQAEIATELGFKSANAAEEHLKAMDRKGVIAAGEGYVARHPAQEGDPALHP